MNVQEISAKSILSKSNLPVCDYSVNPYVGCAHGCRYCYASFMKRFTNHQEPWGSFVDAKNWPEIRRPERYRGKELFIGSVTDPYQPAEKTYGRTRNLLEQLQGSGAKLSIQTKSDLVLRDLDLLQTFPDIRIGFSINTLDEGFRRDMDHAVSIERRIAAMQAVHAAGIRTTCFISPIFPGITDVRTIIERVRGICNLIWLENLNLRGNYRADIFSYIRERHPALLPLYQSIYGKGDRSYWEQLDADIRKYTATEGLTYLRNDDTVAAPFDAPPIVVNYFYHSEIKPSASRAKKH